MKQLLLLALLGATALSLHAQSWFDHHPQWTNYFTVGFAGPGYEYVTVENDTVLGGLPAVNVKRRHEMDLPHIEDYTDYRQLREHGDTVWAWDHDANQFYIQYNFSLAAGDAIIGAPHLDGTVFQYYIDSVGTLDVDDHPLRFQKVHFYDQANSFQCTALAIERIGFVQGSGPDFDTNYHFPLGTHLIADEANELAVDGRDWVFCNYQSDVLQYQHASYVCGNPPQTAATAVALQVLPNPFHDAFSIVASKDQLAGKLRIFNSAGRLVVQSALSNDPISTITWPAGLYLLEITSRTGERQFRKVFKE